MTFSSLPSQGFVLNSSSQQLLFQDACGQFSVLVCHDVNAHRGNLNRECRRGARPVCSINAPTEMQKIHVSVK